MSKQPLSANAPRRKPSLAEQAETDRRRQERLLTRCLVHSLERISAWQAVDRCMSCTEAMGIAASRSSLDDCMKCANLKRIAQDVAVHRSAHTQGKP
jgi:hypothetical protein